MKKIQITKDVLSYQNAIKGDWYIKASTYKDTNILLICSNIYTEDFIMRFFTNYDEAILFIDMIVYRGFDIK